MIMIESRALRSTLLLAAALVAMPVPASAQLGKLRKKVATAVSGATGAGQNSATPGTAAAPSPAPSAPSPFSENVLEITESVLARFELGLDAETARRAEVAAILHRMPTREQRASCEQRVAGEPPMQKLLQDYLAAVEKAGENSAEVMKAAETMDRESRALYDRECGEMLTPERERELQEAPAVAGAATGDFTTYQYGVIRERIAPLCTAGDRLDRTTTGAAVPAGGGIRWVYSSAEVSLLMPRCDDLMKAIDANS